MLAGCAAPVPAAAPVPTSGLPAPTVAADVPPPEPPTPSTLALAPVAPPPTAAPAPTLAVVRMPPAVPIPGQPVIQSDGIYIPPSLDTSRPIQVMVALHGMGGAGGRIGQRLVECADRHGWIVVAPSFAYRDYLDPEQVRLDDKENLPRIRQLLDSLPIASSAGSVRFTERVLLYGFSRGAQAAQRFALFYPDRVQAAAVLSAGSYTVPRATARVDNQDKPLAFPYGVSDLDRYSGRKFDAEALARVPFWIGVGAGDTATAEVPRNWDPYLGKTRVERAQRLADMLRGMGTEVTLELFSGTGHEETAAMRARVCEFLAAHKSPA